MKKIIAAILAVMLAASSLISCSGKTEKDGGDKVQSENNVETVSSEKNNEADLKEEKQPEEVPESESEKSEVETKTAAFETVEEYLLAHPDIAAAVQKSFEGIMEVEIEARDTSLVYIYKTDMFDSLSDNAYSIERMYDAIFGNIAPSLAQALIAMQTVIANLETITIEIKNSSDEVIYSDVITAEDGKAYAEGEDIDISAVGEGGMSVEDYAKILAGEEGYSNETFTVTIEARGNKIVYVYKMNQYIENTSEFRASVEDSYESVRETLGELFASLKTVTPELEGIVYEYVNSNGVVIANCEYTE